MSPPSVLDEIRKLKQMSADAETIMLGWHKKTTASRKKSRKAGSAAHQQQRRPQPIDPDTGADYDLTCTWQVMAGPADDPIRVGSVRRTGPSKQWQARTPALVAISGGPWRTRQNTLVQLVLNHQ